MKYKSATETMNTVKASMIDAKTKEFFELTLDISADVKSAEIEAEAEKIARARRGNICKALDVEIIETHDITYRIPWDKFLQFAEVWKVDGTPVKK